MLVLSFEFSFSWKTTPKYAYICHIVPKSKICVWRLTGQNFNDVFVCWVSALVAVLFLNWFSAWRYKLDLSESTYIKHLIVWRKLFEFWRLCGSIWLYERMPFFNRLYSTVGCFDSFQPSSSVWACSSDLDINTNRIQLLDPNLATSLTIDWSSITIEFRNVEVPWWKHYWTHLPSEKKHLNTSRQLFTMLGVYRIRIRIFCVKLF